jgi:hypothetical protein
MRQLIHQEAVRRFLTEAFGVAVHIGVWSAHPLNPLYCVAPPADG